jgi:uncharacterized phage protein (TIGR01671 family)
MNREIKFRAWNGHEIVYDVMVGKFGAFYINPGDNGNGLDPNDSASLTPFNTKYFATTPIMQFTGLKDKNGKEIYEGDIVSNFGGLDKFFWHPVECHLGEFGYWVEDKERFIGFGGNHHFEWTPQGQSQHIEVLGNLFENPELLHSDMEAQASVASKAP